MMKVVVDPIWPWPVVAAVIAATMLLVLLTYPNRIRHLPPRQRRNLLALRIFSGLVLGFAMLRPAVQFVETDDKSSQLLIVMDASQSMSTKDGPGGTTRRAQALKNLSEHQDLLKKLGDRVEIRRFDFSTDLVPVEEFTEKTEGKFTAIGKVIDQIRQQDTSKRLAGVIMLTDGAQRAFSPDDRDPRAAARRLAEEKGIPIYPMGFGTSQLSAGGRDLAVESILVDTVAFEKKTVPVRTQLRMSGVAGQKVRVKLLLEDRTGKRHSESGELKPVPLTANSRPQKEIEAILNAETQQLELSFVAEQAGEYKVAVEVEPVDGELKLTNNRLESLVSIRKGGLKVAYLDTPRWEMTYLRKLNRTAKVQFDTIVISSLGQQGSARIDPSWFEPGKYDVYILGDLPASTFRSGNVDLLARLRDRMAEGSGLAMIGGIHNFGAGGYSDSPIADFLPVQMSAREKIPLADFAPEQHIGGRIRVLPTPNGLQHYLMRVSPDGKDEELWRKLPAIRGGVRLKPKNEFVEILAETEDQQPILLATEDGRSRIVAMGVDHTWMWRLGGFEQVHARFWEQLILWLAHKELENDQGVWVRIDPRNFSLGAIVPITFGAQDENKRPIPDVEFSVKVTTPDGASEELAVQRGERESTSEFKKTANPGDYWVDVQAKKDGKVLGLGAVARFIIDARNPELDNPAADTNLLADLATITGTTTIAPERFGEFIQTLIDEGLRSELSRHTQVNLWDNWPVLLLFVGLLTVEWFYRKKLGLV